MAEVPGNSESDLDFSLLASFLLDHQLMKKTIGDADDVEETPEFMLLKMLNDHPYMTLEELTKNFNVQAFILSALINLRSHNFVDFDGHLASIQTEFIQSKITESIDKANNQLVRDELNVTISQSLKSSDPIVKKPDDVPDFPEPTSVPEFPTTSKPEIDFDSAVSGKMTRDRLFANLEKSTSPSTEKRKSDTKIDSMFDDLLGEESIDDILGDLQQSSPAAVSGLITPLIDLIKPLGYIDASVSEINYDKIPAYQILNTILKQYPISTEEIEEKISIEASLSMLLSNLKADDLIDQTNDYRWTFSPTALKKLKEHIAGKRYGRVDQSTVDPDIELINSNIGNEVFQFKEALMELGYIDNPEPPLDSYQDKPEVDILNIIRTNLGLTSDQIKEYTDKTMPVVVKRMLSKLQAEGVAEQDSTGKWSVSMKLKFLMAKNKLESSLSSDKFDELVRKFK